MIKNYAGLHVKYPLLLPDFNENWIFSTDLKKNQISNTMKIRPMGAALFHEDGQTDTTMLTVAFRNFVNAPKTKLAVWENKLFAGPT